MKKLKGLLDNAQKDLDDKNSEMVKMLAKKDEAYRMKSGAESELVAIDKEEKATKPQETEEKDHD
jgi:hypothetical protein